VGTEFPGRTPKWCDNIFTLQTVFPVMYSRKEVITVPFSHFGVLSNSPFMGISGKKEKKKKEKDGKMGLNSPAIGYLLCYEVFHVVHSV